MTIKEIDKEKEIRTETNAYRDELREWRKKMRFIDWLYGRLPDDAVRTCLVCRFFGLCAVTLNGEPQKRTCKAYVLDIAKKIIIADAIIKEMNEEIKQTL